MGRTTKDLRSSRVRIRRVRLHVLDIFKGREKQIILVPIKCVPRGTARPALLNMASIINAG